MSDRASTPRRRSERAFSALSSPARRNLFQRFQPTSFGSRRCFGLGACTVRTFVVMDAALCVGLTGVVQLEAGLAMKLKNAAATCGTHSVPVGSHESNGMLWATLMMAAQLDAMESAAVYNWLEQAYSAEMSTRAQDILPLAHVPAVTVPQTLTTPSAAVAPRGGQADTISALLAALGVATPHGLPAVTPAVTALQPAAVSATMRINLLADIAEQQITEGDLAPATYALHTASMPPADDASIKYHCGVENGKSYRHHAAATHNNTLLKLCNDSKTTVADFNDHILAASSCLGQAGLQSASTRLTSAWMQIQSCLPVAPMISKYFSEYLRKYAGRFLPVLVDQLLVQKVMTHLVSDSCSRSKSADDAMALVNDLRGDIHLLTSTIRDLKSGLAAAKSEVTEMKKKVAELEKPKPICSYCKGNNHTERNCHVKAADVLRKAAAAPVP